jgi:Protein of unknown function (DUF2934)
MARKQASEKKVVVSSAPAVPARRKSVSPNRVTRPAVEISNTPGELEVRVESAMVMAPVESLQDAVARLAYSYWESRGRHGGSPEADWLRAEQELAVK